MSLKPAAAETRRVLTGLWSLVALTGCPPTPPAIEVADPAPVEVIEPVALIESPAPVVSAAPTEPVTGVRVSGPPILVGAISADEFLYVIETHMPVLGKCARSPVPEPQVLIKLTITHEGSVSGALMKTPSGSYSVDRCLEKAFMDMHFPPPGNGLVVAAVPIDLGVERGHPPAPRPDPVPEVAPTPVPTVAADPTTPP